MPKSDKADKKKEVDAGKAAAPKEKDSKPEANGKSGGAGSSEPKSVAAAKKPTDAEVLAAFLKEHAITDQKSLAAFKNCEILSLDDLVRAKADDEVREEVEKALRDSGSKFGLARFKGIAIEAIKSALFFEKILMRDRLRQCY